MAEVDRWEIAVDLELGDLRTKLAQARTQLASTEQQLQRMARVGAQSGRQVADGWTPFQRNITATAASIYSLRTAFNAIRGPIESFYRRTIASATQFSSTIVNQSEQIGASTTNVQLLSSGLQAMSGSAGTAFGVFRMLSRSISSAAGGGGLRMPPKEAFKQLGVSVKEAGNIIKPVSQIIDELSVSFNKMPDGPRKTALAISVFGYSAGHMLSLFRDLNTAGRTWKEELTRLGLVIPQHLIAPTKQLDNALNISRMQTERFFQLFGAQAAPAVLPFIKSLQDLKAELLHWVADQDSIVIEFTAGMMDKFKAVADNLKKQIGGLPQLDLGTKPYGAGSALGVAGATTANTFVMAVGLVMIALGKLVGAFDVATEAVFRVADRFEEMGAKGVGALLKEWMTPEPAKQTFGLEGAYQYEPGKESKTEHVARMAAMKYWSALDVPSTERFGPAPGYRRTHPGSPLGPYEEMAVPGPTTPAPIMPGWMRRGEAAPPVPSGMPKEVYDQVIANVRKMAAATVPETPEIAAYKQKLGEFQIARQKSISGVAGVVVPPEPVAPAGYTPEQMKAVHAEMGFPEASGAAKVISDVGNVLFEAGKSAQVVTDATALLDKTLANTRNTVTDYIQEWKKLEGTQGKIGVEADKAAAAHKKTNKELAEQAAIISKLTPFIKEMEPEEYGKLAPSVRAAIEHQMPAGVTERKTVTAEGKEVGQVIPETQADKAFKKKIEALEQDRQAMIRGAKAALQLKMASEDMKEVNEGLRNQFMALSEAVDKQKRSVERLSKGVSELASYSFPDTAPVRHEQLEMARERAKAEKNVQEEARLTSEIQQLYQKDDIQRAREISKQKIQLKIDVVKSEIGLNRNVVANFKQQQDLEAQLRSVDTANIVDEEKRKVDEILAAREIVLQGTEEQRNKELTRLHEAGLIETQLVAAGQENDLALRRKALAEVLALLDKELEARKAHAAEVVDLQTKSAEQAAELSQKSFEEQRKTYLVLRDVMLKGVDDMFSGVVLGTQKLKDVWKSLWASLVQQTVHGFGEVIAKKLDFEGKLNLNFYELGQDIAKKWKEIFGPGGEGIGGIVKKGLAAVFGQKEAAEDAGILAPEVAALEGGGLSPAEGGGLVSAMGEVPVTEAAEGAVEVGQPMIEGLVSAAPATAQAAKAAISVAGAGAGAAPVVGAATTAAQGGMSTMLGGAETAGQASSALGSIAAPEAGGGIAGVGQAVAGAAGGMGGGGCCPQLGKDVTSGMKDVFGDFKDKFIEGFGKLKEGIGKAVDWLKKGFTDLPDKLEDVGGLISKGWKGASKYITEDLGSDLKGLGTSLMNGLGSLGTMLGDIGGALADGFKTVAMGLYNILADAASHFQIFGIGRSARGSYFRGETMISAQEGAYLRGSQAGIPILAHPFEGILNSPATAKVGGERGIMALNKGLIPREVVGRVLRGEGVLRPASAADGLFVSGGVPIPRIPSVGGGDTIGGSRSLSIGEGAIQVHMPQGMPVDGNKFGRDLIDGITSRWGR